MHRTVSGTLRSALRHELLVVLLRVLLIHLVGLDLHLELVRELLDERGRAAGALLLVRAGRGGRRRRSNPTYPKGDLQTVYFSREFRGSFSAASKPIFSSKTTFWLFVRVLQ